MEMPPKLPKLRPMTCSWDYAKLSYEEKKNHNRCLCWNECPVLQRKKEERIANAKGFWKRLFAKLF